MSKRTMEDYDRDSMIESIRCRREELGEPTQFTPPAEDQKWRARDLIDIHWNLTGIETPSESYNRIMSCIIGHANPTTGRCQIKQKLIAAETGYCVKTVRRAVDWWVSRGFLIEQDMGLARSRAFHPEWDLFEMYWLAIAEDIRAQKETCKPPMDIKGSIAVDTKGSIDGGHHGVQHESQSRTSKDESHPEWARSQASVATHENKKEKEGIQGEGVASTSSHQPANPEIDTTSEGQTYAATYSALARQCTAFEWEHLTEAEFDAAVVAEMERPGSGRATMKAAANEAWKRGR